jgi:sterol desaturase/sphingolipid hydroxylase (fatty acid hydroxylase superfamily)
MTVTITRPPAPVESPGRPKVRRPKRRLRRPSKRRPALTAWSGVLAVAGGAVGLGIVGWSALSGAGDLGSSVVAARQSMVAPALLLVILVILVAERRWPAVPQGVITRARVVDGAYLALFAVVVAPALMLVETGLAVEVQRHARFLTLQPLPAVPKLAVVAVVLVAMDALNWTMHVANHRSAALWRLHAVHHSQEEMSVLTTFRTHPLVHASYLPAILPALVLGASGTVPRTALVVYAGLVTLPHANLRWTFGPLRGTVVSPAYHRLHHVSEAIDDRGPVNFGFVLVWWDRLAGRAVLAEAGAAVPTGIAGRPVPVEQAASRAGVARVVLAQLAQPFAVRTDTDGAR